MTWRCIKYRWRLFWHGKCLKEIAHHRWAHMAAVAELDRLRSHPRNPKEAK